MDDASVLVCVTRFPLSLLTRGDESAMNLEDVGILSSEIPWFPKHFYELGVNFAGNVASPLLGVRDASSGLSYGLGLQRDSHIRAGNMQGIGFLPRRIRLLRHS